MRLQDEMFQLIEDWRRSGLTKVDFLRNKAVTKHKFGYWINKYNKINNSDSQLSGNIEEVSTNDFKEYRFSSCFESPQKKIFELTTESGLKISVFE